MSFSWRVFGLRVGSTRKRAPCPALRPAVSRPKHLHASRMNKPSPKSPSTSDVLAFAASGQQGCWPSCFCNPLALRRAVDGPTFVPSEYRADHAGVSLKDGLADYLKRTGFQMLDFAEAIGKAILSIKAERGVLDCGSGVGASVAANKLHGIRVGLSHDSYSMRQGVDHDNMTCSCSERGSLGPSPRTRGSLCGCASFSNDEWQVRRLRKTAAMENTADSHE